MEEIFRTIFTACKTLSWLKQISAEEGQLEAIDQEGQFKPVVLLPCLLIDAQITQWEAGDLNTQSGAATIVTRFAYRKTTDQSNLSGIDLFNASLVALKNRSLIESAIANAPALAGVHGRISRMSTHREKRSDGFIVYQTTWMVSVDEIL